MRCCGSPFQAIVVQAGRGALELMRCSHCGDQRWALDGVMLQRGEAFAALADAFREGPLQARAVRDRAAHVTAARAAQRAAAREEAAREEAAREEAAPAPVAAAAPAVAAPARDRVVDLLAGWQVLGAGLSATA